ncbi:hypothetical protein COY27_00385 [Candidatus Woesearchaeota archaeon CG_4_10_14_0_2_um_filter_33_13]|nr:MAG: hypothetical protein COY27_00385 [Candidatus Woesearchaeota archaeon CG_4_10_14_0_2_um_filter_33_13]
MIYIHNLRSLNQKSAETEATYLLRPLREKAKFPLNDAFLIKELDSFFISNTDLETISLAFPLLEKLPLDLEQLKKDNQGELYENINILRTHALLKEFPEPLQNNLQYLKDLMQWQNGDLLNLFAFFNQIPYLKINNKAELNTKLNNLFQTLLRTSNFTFGAMDIINEAHLEHSRGLVESFSKGYLIHIYLEEQMKALSFEQISRRVPPAELQKLKEMEGNIKIINKSIEKAYEVNMRMIELAVNLYTFTKWAMEIQLRT